MYISITECGLTEAQKFIKALTTELELGILRNSQRDNKRDIGFDFGFLIRANAEGNSTTSISVCRSSLTTRFA